MTQKFDPKVYRGKARVYVPVAGHPGIQKLMVWTGDQYAPPPRGKAFLARRPGLEGREVEYHDTLAEAREWRNRLSSAPADVPTGGPLFGDVVAKWKADCYPGLSAGTRLHYDNRLRLHLGPLLERPLYELTPKAIDEWIIRMKANVDRYGKGKIRTSFLKELTLLTIIMRHYFECADDPRFVVPIRRRHRKLARLHNRRPPKRKDIRPEEVAMFIDALAKGPDGLAMSVMATIQFEHSRRISEVAALEAKDVHQSWADPRRSRITFLRHVIWLRGSREDSFVDHGSKTSRDMLSHSMTPRSFDALARYVTADTTGPLFVPAEGGDFFTYRQIQYRYNLALERAGLPYSSTHIMRHGGATSSYDASGANYEVAAAKLGNKSRESVDTYLHVEQRALDRHVQAEWDAYFRAHPGRKWSQTGSVLELA